MSQTFPFQIHTCEYCSAENIPQPPKGFDGDIIIKYTMRQVSDGASRNCLLFQGFLAGFELSAAQDTKNLGLSGTWIYILLVHVTANLDYKYARGYWKEPTQKRQYSSGFFFLLAFPGDPASDYLSVIPASQDYESIASTSMALSLLQECQESHQSCRKQHPDFVPTRLLRLYKYEAATGIGIRLLVIAQSPFAILGEKYATLTYCWGGNQEMKLTAASMKILQHGITTANLPKTLRDSIYVCWILGLQLIWIDCLCIVQDDPEDVAGEIAALPLIFGNAHVTISASRAAHSNEGFLQLPANYPPLESSIVFKLPHTCPDGRTGSVGLYSPHLGDPILSRAWTFPEFMLSRRILCYTSSQLTWNCRTISWSQQKRQFHEARMQKIYTSFYEGARDRSAWLALVYAYTRRRLSFQGDLLPALSGLAEMWQDSSDSYVAGLWLSHLPLGLFWRSEDSHRQKQREEYRAPSWSWACLDRDICWEEGFITSVDPSFTLVSCVTVPKYTNAPYGAVISGALTVQGHLLQATLPASGNDFYLESGSSKSYINPMHFQFFMDYEGEVLRAVVNNSEIYFLQICLLEQGGQGPSGLVLIKSAPGKYLRIGIFCFINWTCLDNHSFERRNILTWIRNLGGAIAAQKTASTCFKKAPLEIVVIL